MIIKRLLILPLLLLAMCTSYALSEETQIDSTLKEIILKELHKENKKWNTHFEEVRIDTFWNDVYKVSTYSGLDQDPVPPPSIYYYIRNTKLVNSFKEVLQSLGYVPEDELNALNTARLLIKETEREAVVIDKEETRKLVPKDLIKKYKVKLPVIVTDTTNYMITFFTYQTAQSPGFSRRHRNQELKMHTVIFGKSKLDYKIKELYHDLP